MINVRFELEGKVCGNGLTLMIRKLRGLPSGTIYQEDVAHNQLRYGLLTGKDERDATDLNKGSILVNDVWVFPQHHYTSEDTLDLQEALTMASYFKKQDQLAGVVAVHPRDRTEGSAESAYTRCLRCLIGRVNGPNVSLTLIDDSNFSVFSGDQYEFVRRQIT